MLNFAVAIVVDTLGRRCSRPPPTSRTILRAKALTCNKVLILTTLVTLVTDIIIQDSRYSSLRPPLPPWFRSITICPFGRLGRRRAVKCCPVRRSVFHG